MPGDDRWTKGIAIKILWQRSQTFSRSHRSLFRVNECLAIWNLVSKSDPGGRDVLICSPFQIGE